jgi:hypothetical protein
MTDKLPEHSTLGASSMERWANCPGSVELLKHLGFVEVTDDPEYRRDGTAAHALAAICLETGADAWERIGETIADVEVSSEMANAVQVYLDRCRMGDPDNCGIEQRISSERHPLYYGTVDRWELYQKDRKLVVRDYKHGVGIVVEVEDNVQVLYYAWGILQLPDCANVETVELEIVQPRAWSGDGQKWHTWTVSADYVRKWGEEVLFPLMARVAFDRNLDPGAHCRFCPAKLVCPVLVSVFGAMAKADVSSLVHVDDGTLGRDYGLIDAAKAYMKALTEQVDVRLKRGVEVPNAKLVMSKVDRVWKPEAETVMVQRYGDKALVPAVLKSPAEMEKVDTEAKALVKTWAFKPEGRLVAAPLSDKRKAVRTPKLSELFKEGLVNVSEDQGAG